MLFLDLNISLDYENLVSPVTRLYELYCYIGGEKNQQSIYFNTKPRNEFYDSKYEQLTGNKIPKDSKIIGFGYVYDRKKTTKLISIVAGNLKNEVKEQVARKLLSYYESINIKLPLPDTWV